MSKLEMGLWAADFIITGIGWALGGGAAAVFCFLVGGILIFFVVSREEKNDPTSPSRLKKWHRYGMATFIALVVILGGAALVRRVTMAAAIPQNSTQQQQQLSPRSVVAQATSSATKEPKPTKRSPAKGQTQTNSGRAGNTQQRQQQQNSSGTNTQQQSSENGTSQQCAPGASCAMSTGQQGGITAGQVNIDTHPHIAISDEQQSAIKVAMEPFAGQSAFILANGNTKELIDFCERFNAALIGAHVNSEFHTGMSMSEGNEPSKVLYVGYNDKTSDMAKTFMKAVSDSKILPMSEISYHHYDNGSQNLLQIIVNPPN